MKRIGINSKFAHYVDILADIILTNLTFMLFCIPIITIPSAITAMNGMVMGLYSGKKYSLSRFFKVFIRDFLPSLYAGLLVVLITAIMLVDYHLMAKEILTIPKVMVYGIYVLAFIMLSGAVYIFPMISCFENTFSAYIKNSLIISFKYLPKTITIIILTLLPIVILLVSIDVFLYTSILWVVFGFAMVAFVNARTINTIFENEKMAQEESNN